MESVDSIYLRLYFPNFSHPNSSRFSSFFHSMEKKNKILTKNEYIPSKIIYPEKIIQGVDKRSSIVLKNIPKSWNKKSIRKLIETYGNLNYFYIIPDTNNKFTSCVYINLINYKSIVNIYMSLRKLKFNIDNKVVDIEIYYSLIQGKKDLIKEFNED